MKTLVLRALSAACLMASMASAQADVVPVSSTIQDAVNRAKPGDTIFVPPGTYRETVRVLKHNITIVGPDNAVIDASGFDVS